MKIDNEMRWSMS